MKIGDKFEFELVKITIGRDNEAYITLENDQFYSVTCKVKRSDVNV